jgi:hypothetical protein
MPGVTDEQIAAARSVDLLTWLQDHEPGSFKKSGPGEYCLAEHDSLKISHGKWFWFSRGFGSNNALDFLVQVRGQSFMDAVNILADNRAAPPPSRPQPPPDKRDDKLFALPIPNRNYHRAIAYLMGRGIDRAVIDECIQAKTFYESAKRHDCVFVGRDTEGKARFACKRGICGDYKKDVSGSDKRYSFSMPARGESAAVNVFESPIDALSFATMERSPMDGCFDWRKEHYLSLGGVSSRALTQFLTDRPEVRDVRLRLDNDEAGIKAMERITAELKENPAFAGFRLMSEPSPIGKDWNDLIQHIKAQNRAEKTRSRPGKEAVSTL